MPDSLSHSTPSLYADDTEIWSSSRNYADLVAKVNIDLENTHKWMLKNKLQIHPTKSKYMTIGSSYNLKISEIEKLIYSRATHAEKRIWKRCFSYNGAVHWNNLPNEAKIAESLRSFKSILKQRMS